MAISRSDEPVSNTALDGGADPTADVASNVYGDTLAHEDV
jgi:hypothetical protein